MRAKVFLVATVASAVVGLAIWKFKEAPKVEVSKSNAAIASSQPWARSAVAMAVSASPASPLAPVETVASSAIVKAASYSGERDLWAFAHKAAASGGSANVFEALAATRTCQQFLATSPQLSAFLGGGKSQIQGARTPEREQAITEMKSRCAGFEQNEAEARSFAKALSASLDGTPYALHSTTISKPQLRELLVSEAPDAVALATIHLLEPWQRALHIPDNDPREADLSVALALSKCELGFDCSSNGTQSLDQCIYAGVCGRDVRDVMSMESDQQMIARVNGYRQQIVEAIRNRNWAAIGL